MKKYVITYEVLFGDTREKHVTKVDNCMSELHAQIKLEGWLKKKHPSFKRLFVEKISENSLFFDLFRDIDGF